MPDIVDVFGQAPFVPLELTGMITRITPRPTLLGRLGQNLFRQVPSHTGRIAIYENEQQQRLISTSPLGAPPENLEKRGGRMRMFATHRLAKGSTLQAIELQNILQQPLFQAVQGVQQELATRSALIRDDFELTWEYHRLGAVLCKGMDADGTTVLHDWYDEFEIDPPAPFYMELDNPDTNLRLTTRSIVNHVKDQGRGAFTDGASTVHALCGEEFFTKLITHPQIEKLYLNYVAAAELLNKVPDQFQFGGVVWHDYRSALDPRFGIAPNSARYFPVGAGDVFQHVNGPAEFPPYINNPGRDIISISFGDRDRQAWQRVEFYSYPLMMNTRPEMCGEILAGTAPTSGGG